jgi:hypothetical protein
MYNNKNRTMSQSKDIRDLLHKIDYSRAMDLRGNPIGDICVCGCDVFVLLGGFVDGEIAFYFTDGECAGCGSMVTLPTPIDGDEIANI